MSVIIGADDIVGAADECGFVLGSARGYVRDLWSTPRRCPSEAEV